MTKIGKITSLEVAPFSLVNGESTNYGFVLIPGVELKNGDVLYITFPEEILLPTSYYLTCEAYDFDVSSCVKSSSREVRITISDLSSSYDYTEPLYMYISNVINPVSFKSTGLFKDIKLVSKYGNEIASYSSNLLFVTMNVKADFSYVNLHQSSLAAG